MTTTSTHQTLTYKINTIYPTIQGEGALTGTPMVIVRLQGCDVGCPFCDTKETWMYAGGEDYTPAQIVDAILDFSPRPTGLPRWALLTGGEPGDQALGPLLTALYIRNIGSAIETSGTANGFLNVPNPPDWLCVSPKQDMPGGRAINPEVIEVADELKFVIGKQEDLAKVHTFLAQYEYKEECVVSLQPMSLSKHATNIAVGACLANGWHLSLQTHKFIDIP
jgi:7-carboxy-7-deazaguanine synthase